MQKHLILFSVVLIVLVSCKNKKTKASPSTAQTENVQKTGDRHTTEPEQQQQSKIQALKKYHSQIVDTDWTLIEVMGKQILEQEDLKQKPYLRLNNNMQFQAHGGCNGFFGNYEFMEKNFVSFSNIAMTEMACQFTHYDSELNEALQMTRQIIVVNPEEIHLTVGKRAPLAKLRRILANQEKE